jgi:hypothetical protein
MPGRFCDLLRAPAHRICLDRLIAYYLKTGRGMKLDRVTNAIIAMEALSDLLDQVIGGGAGPLSRNWQPRESHGFRLPTAWPRPADLAHSPDASCMKLSS